MSLELTLKYISNVRSDIVVERILRRLRHQLYIRILSFPLPGGRWSREGERLPINDAEVEPLGSEVGEVQAMLAFRAERS